MRATPLTISMALAVLLPAPALGQTSDSWKWTFSPMWASLVFGYKGQGVDFGSDTDDENLQKYDVTYYGPIFGLNFHWGGR